MKRQPFDMARRAGVLALLLLSLSALVSATLAFAGEEAGRQVFDGEALRAAGVGRLSDVLSLVDGWDAATIDGFTWQTIPLGLALYEERQWDVMVDGQRVDMDVFGTGGLERLPVSLASIDSIEVITLPQVYDGRFVGASIIHIHTKRPRDGLVVRGRATAGNETGDPGPYQFTKYTSPNVERTGPDFDVGLSYGNGTRYIQAGISTSTHYASDSATKPRMAAIAGGAEPAINVVAPSLTLGGELLGGRHELYVGYSFVEDFLFFEPLGREVPVESRLMHAGLGGNFDLHPGTSLDYGVSYGADKLDRRTAAKELDFDWREATYRAELGLSRRGRSFGIRAGADVALFEVDTGHELRDGAPALARFSLAGDYAHGEALSERAGVSVSVADGDAGVSGAFGLAWRPSHTQVVSADASHSERLPIEDRRIWYWQEQGYGLLDDAGVPAASALGVARRTTGDVSWGLTFGPHAARLGGFYRYFGSVHLEDHIYQFDASEHTFAGPVTVAADHSGHVAGGCVSFDVRPAGRVRLNSHYRFLRATGGSTLFKDRWREMPEHVFRETILYRPVDNLTLWSRISYWSETTWRRFRDVGEQSGGLFSPTVDDAFLLDVAIEKWFWRRKLRGHLSFRNLLDEPVRYHPAGASFDLSVFVQIEMVLGSPAR